MKSFNEWLKENHNPYAAGSKLRSEIRALRHMIMSLTQSKNIDSNLANRLGVDSDKIFSNIDYYLTKLVGEDTSPERPFGHSDFLPVSSFKNESNNPYGIGIKLRHEIGDLKRLIASLIQNEKVDGDLATHLSTESERIFGNIDNLLTKLGRRGWD